MDPGERLELVIPAEQRLGDKVIVFDEVSKGFGDRLLFDDLSFILPPAGIVGVIGANGAGKTTLFRMITGDEQPDSGTIEIGDTVDLAYVDQSRDALDADRSVYDEISEGYEVLKVGGREINARAYVASFGFKGSDQQQKVGVPLATAFERMFDRMPLQEVNFFAIVVAIQAQTGGNLAEALTNLSAVLRGRARLDGNRYFGPFIPASEARRSLKLVPRFFRVATCNEVFDGRRRPCLYYHLDQCLAPCAGKTTPEVLL